MLQVRKRLCEVPEHGTYRVPTNVSRVDSPGWHGWQVRIKTTGAHAWFSDSTHGSCRRAFFAACAWADEQRPEVMLHGIKHGRFSRNPSLRASQ